MCRPPPQREVLQLPDGRNRGGGILPRTNRTPRIIGAACALSRLGTGHRAAQHKANHDDTTGTTNYTDNDRHLSERRHDERYGRRRIPIIMAARRARRTTRTTTDTYQNGGTTNGTDSGRYLLPRRHDERYGRRRIPVDTAARPTRRTTRITADACCHASTPNRTNGRPVRNTAYRIMRTMPSFSRSPLKLMMNPSLRLVSLR